MKWKLLCRIVPMYWLAGIYVHSTSPRRSNLAGRIYVWLETRRVHEELRNDYQERGYDV